jgi:hypothetical protein
VGLLTLTGERRRRPKYRPTSLLFAHVVVVTAVLVASVPLISLRHVAYGDLGAVGRAGLADYPGSQETPHVFDFDDGYETWMFALLLGAILILVAVGFGSFQQSGDVGALARNLGIGLLLLLFSVAFYRKFSREQA